MRLGFRSEFDFRIKLKILNNNIGFTFFPLDILLLPLLRRLFVQSMPSKTRIWGAKIWEMQGYLLRLNVYPENGFRIPFSRAYSWQSYSKLRADRGTDRRTDKHIVPREKCPFYLPCKYFFTLVVYLLFCTLNNFHPSQNMMSVAIVSFSSCQRNLIKTFQIDGMIALITKMDLIFSWDLLNGQK